MFAQPGRGCSFCGRDLWDVSHYVSAGPVAICDLCVEAARVAIEEAPPAAGRELFLPPRVFGDGGTARDADSISEAFRVVFTSASTTASRDRLIDGPPEVKEALAEAGSRLAGLSASTRVERIRFVDAETAEVRFQINVGPHPMGPLVDGRAIRKGGRWLIASETVLRVADLGGVRSTFGRTLNP